MNQSQSQFAHLMNNYTSTTSEQQLLQQYLASASAFPHPHNLALHNMTNTLNGSTNSLLNNLNSLNNFAAFGNLAAVMASQQTNLTPSSLLTSANSSSTPSTNSLNQTNNSMFAVLLQAQQRLKGLNNLNSLNASNLLQKYDQSNNNNSQQSPSSVSNCSSPPTCSSVTPPTPPLVPTSTLQLLAAQHYNLPLSTLASSTSSTNNTLSNSLSNSLGNCQSSLTNTTNSSSSNNLPTSLSEAAAAVLSGQSNLNQLVANSQTLDSLTQKRLTVSPDDTSNELVDLQQYYQLNALSLLNSAGLTFNNNLNQLSTSKLNSNQPIKDLAKIYSAINSASNLTDLNSPINSSLSSSSSSTNSLQNTMTSLQQHSQMMAAAMASTNSFAHNPHMQLLSPNSIKTLKFSIENILNPSFGKNQQDLMNSLVTSQQQSTNLTSAQSMTKLLEFNKQQQHNKNGLISSQTTNKLTNFINNNNTTKQKLKLEEINSNINGLSSIVNNLNPGLGALDFKLNSTKRKKRSSSSMDDSCEKDFDLTRNVKRKNSIDSDCSNSNSSGHTKLMNNNQTDIKSINKSTNNQTDLNIKSPSSPKKNKLPTAEEIKAGLVDVPAWVLCTRYSDRPSSGPRSRKQKKKDKTIDEKRPRTAFTSEQLNQLKQEFISSPYLSDQKRMELSKKLQLNESQIKIWFQNKRAKSKKSSSHKSPLALQLSSQGLYNHSTVAIDSDEEGEENRSVNTEISNIKSPNCAEQTD